MASILDQGDYRVYLDAGFLVDAFRLDLSVLDGTDVLDGSTAYFDVTQYVQAVSISRGRRTRSHCRWPCCSYQSTGSSTSACHTLRELAGDTLTVNARE